MIKKAERREEKNVRNYSTSGERLSTSENKETVKNHTVKMYTAFFLKPK